METTATTTANLADVFEVLDLDSGNYIVSAAARQVRAEADRIHSMVGLSFTDKPTQGVNNPAEVVTMLTRAAQLLAAVADSIAADTLEDAS